MCDSGQPKYLDERPQLEAFERDFFSGPHWAEKSRPEHLVARDRLWVECPRGDWLLWVAEKAGVPYEALVDVTWPIVYVFLGQYVVADTEDELYIEVANAVSVVNDYPNDHPESRHWLGHRLHAHADVLHALAHLAHGTGHHGVGHPALALHHCQVAALMAYQPEGATEIVSARVEGDRLAKERTARMVREAMPPPSHWAETYGVTW